MGQKRAPYMAQRMVRDVETELRYFTLCDSDLYFVEREEGSVYNLWKRNHSSGELEAIISNNEIPPTEGYMKILGIANEKLLFVNWDEEHGSELWSSDGAAEELPVA